MSRNMAVMVTILAAATWGADAARAADIKIGYTLSITGPAASLGVPQKNTVGILPAEIGGHKVRYIVLDDGGDATRSVANARKLVTEEKVDVLIGSSITPPTMPLLDVAAETGTLLIANVPAQRTVSPVDDKRRWVFKVIQGEALLARAIADHMAKAGIKSVGFIGFNDAYGEGYYNEFKTLLPERGIAIAAKEGFARADTSVTGQVLKLLAAKPDAVLVVAAGTPAVLPAKTLKERGFDKTIYQTAGIATQDFIRVGGKDVEGTVFSAGPVLVAEQLPAHNASRAIGMDYIKRYEEAYKTPFAAFGAHVDDAVRFISRAVPPALKAGTPGTPAFRAALRDALETGGEVPLAHGVANITAKDHNGLDDRAAVMVRIENGAWKLVP